MNTVQISKLITERIITLLNRCNNQIQVKQIQAQIILHNLHSHTTLASHFITSCQNHNLLNTAFHLYTITLPKPHLFIFNTLIRAFSHSHIPNNTPFTIYTHMHHNSITPNNYTFPFLFKSLSDSREFILAQSVHTHVVKFCFLDDIYVQNSLLDVYASCGYVTTLCKQLFDEMPKRDVVSWTVLIMGFKNVGRCDDALLVFEQMQYVGVVPNQVTMVNALAACAKFGAIEMGIWIHDMIRRNGWELDVRLGTALIDMYSKCGRVEEGLSVFKSMKEKNVFTWNAVIKGLALAKSGIAAIYWFNRMEQDGIKADEVTLIAVLSACSHSGLVDMGRKIFGFLSNQKYGFHPNAKHYACIVDLFARSGCLQEAIELMKCMPFEPTKAMWGSLLVGSKSQGDLEFSEFAAKKLVELEPDNTAYYIHLSNLYAEMGRWSDVEKVRKMMKDRKLTKDLGFSFLEVEQGGNVRELLA
ncbi:putative tetratricopeptide-like helical domain-containing protein [Lupinus albus]|uniref:Putative tetratricopeptide-like helical domain-containing protein n=1 Tax=Lupinus albus TaxID=3870 RepID=A0A6A4QMP1_LUPAL|nr:putative tetratricopeptide-like helical domain-containing protein [Lupinus albus]